MIVEEYKNEEERENLIENYISSGFYLIAEKRIVEGNFVVFTKNPDDVYMKEPEPTVEEKVKTLEQENLNIMLAAAETYETMYTENTNLMIAIAEVYETMLGGVE